jgi:malic enzyme
MKKFFLIVLCLIIVAAMAFASDAGKASSMKGWVSDAKCAAKGAGAAHASCAKACVKGGEKAVFVSDADGKVYPISNQDSVKDHVGDHVQIMAANADGSLQVSKVEALK